MKPLVIYHDNCADGFGAAFAARLALGNDAEYLPCKYEEDAYNKMLKRATSSIVDRKVYILDFSFPLEDMYNLFSHARRVIWLDHHRTAFEMFCHTERQLYFEYTDKRHITLDNNKSGAYLAWEYFHPDTEIPPLIRHIDDYDRWQFKLDGTKAFNKTLWSLAPWTFSQWKSFLNETNTTEVNSWYREGAAILRAHNQNVQSVVKGASRKCEIKTDDGLPYPGLAANCPPHLTSDVGHELANQSKSYGLCWTLSKTKLTAQCSLRSNGDYDVSAIAKAFGGGGHKNAAGFEVDIQTLLTWLT